MLSTGDATIITNILTSLDREANLIVKNAIQLAFASKGGATYSEIINMTRFEIKILEETIKEYRSTIAEAPSDKVMYTI